MSMDTQSLIKGLNPPQADAVQTLDGPLLILAGAGSGKTRVLTHRMANLIASQKASPDEVLAVTFTNKAAREMEGRIFQILSSLGYGVREPLWVSTFHSFCNRLLREQITLLGYRPFFGIYDDSDQLSQIKKVMTALNINDKIHPAKSFRSRINTAKMWALGPDEVAKSSKLFLDAKTIEVYKRYEEEMKRANSLDFGDLLLKVYELFRMYPDVLESYRNKFKYVMVDEYQDTNHIQYLLVKMLTEGHRNLCVVGDEDQSIYSWRGADIRNILDFEKDYPEAKVVKLEENYRSSGNIVTAATSVIRNNSERKDKTLFTSNKDGDLIHVREERNEYDEARFVVKSIQALMNDGTAAYSDFAIFYRTNAQSRVLEEQLRATGTPHRLIGGTRFYERMEIKDVLAYLKLTVNPTDDVAFKRVVNVPARGIGKTTIEKLEEFSLFHSLDIISATQKAIDEKIFNAGTTSKLRNFLLLLADLRELSENHPLLDFYQLVLEKTGYLQALQVEETTESRSRIENLEEFSNAMTQYMKERPDATMLGFLEEMALVSDVDTLANDENSVTLMTLHVSKGLEYPYVFVVGLEEGLFPSIRPSDDEENSMEEERRLAYVGMTRAREKLFLTYARSRKVWGQEQFNSPSRFLSEIPKELVQHTTAIAAPSFVQRAQNSYAAKKPSNSWNDDYDQSFPEDDFGSSESSSSSFKKGMRVRHPTFGSGSVYEVEGSGDQTKVSVIFADQTIKKFVVKFARLERI